MAKRGRPRHITVLFVPHSGPRTYRICLSAGLCKGLVVLAFAFMVGLGAFSYAYRQMCGHMGELARLRMENAAQRQALHELSAQASAVEERGARVGELEESVRQLIEEDELFPRHLKERLLHILSRPVETTSRNPDVRTSDVSTESPAMGGPGPTDGEPMGGELAAVAVGIGPGDIPGPDKAAIASVPLRLRTGPLASRGVDRLWAALSPAGGLLPAGGLPFPIGDPTSAGESRETLPNPLDPYRQALTAELEQATVAGDGATRALETVQELLTQRQDMLSALPQCFPVAGRLTSDFGYRRSPFGRRLEFHSGVDLAAPHGTPVRAVAAGVVLSAGRKPGLGLTIEIDHGHGIRTVYGHHSRLLVEAGQVVKAGQVIARVGDTGRSTGDHLHFELHFLGRPQDPWPYLQRVGRVK